MPLPASSAYDSAEHSAASPASTNDTTTAGPAVGAASASTTKIPVPRVAPTDSATSGSRPSVRFSGVCAPSSLIRSAGFTRVNCCA